MTNADKATLTVLMASNEEFQKMIDSIDKASGSAQKNGGHQNEYA